MRYSKWVQRPMSWGENQGPGPGSARLPPPCGLTLLRESTVETALRENSSTTRAATRAPMTVRIRASPARCTVSSEAHRARSRSFSSRSSGWLWGRVGVGRGAEPPAWALEGVQGPPATLPGGRVVSCPQSSLRDQSHGLGPRGPRKGLGWWALTWHSSQRSKPSGGCSGWRLRRPRRGLGGRREGRQAWSG